MVAYLPVQLPKFGIDRFAIGMIKEVIIPIGKLWDEAMTKAELVSRSRFTRNLFPTL
jgi:hypothetical protein